MAYTMRCNAVHAVQQGTSCTSWHIMARYGMERHSMAYAYVCGANGDYDDDGANDVCGDDGARASGATAAGTCHSTSVLASLEQSACSSVCVRL